ncbi:caspase family protein [Gemmata sp. G18]|uniref:Caspase family protein n=1 Tax=Gemmata palustris TaxID=2822762 RepID=A0ABS5BQ57_9BACT|nr:caspase family protein [Gemmata palustris]MBP3955832.1 caspase family protein [Gemmata palustris]
MTVNALFFTIAAATFFVEPAAAQQFDRRSREEPEIVVEAGGRVGPCDVLRFTSDGKYLFAAGDDKVVRVWPHAAAGLETDRVKVQTLRWRAWREQRGGIKAVSATPDGKRVVVGGYGMKPSTVAVLDRATGDTVAITWPVSREGDANFNVVTAVAFHADGKRVGFGTADGSLWIWDTTRLEKSDPDGRSAAPPVRVGKHEPPKDLAATAGFNLPRLIYFPDKHTLVSVAQSGQVYSCHLVSTVADAPKQAPPGKELFNVNATQRDDARVYRAELIDDGKWLLIASVDAKVLLCSADGTKTIKLALGANQFPRSVAWQPKTRQLAVGVGAALPTGDKPRFFSDGDDQIWIYADPLAEPDLQPRKFHHAGRAEALAFHPAEPHLAIAGGEADEITLRRLTDWDKPLSVVRGAGRRPWAVNVSENGKIVGVQVERDPKSIDPNARGTGAWTRFDLSRLKPTLDENQVWMNPRPEADGWTIVPHEKNRFIWFAERTREGKTERLRLALDRNRDQAPTCFTFLPASADYPTRVLIGHYYGCTLFELVPDRAKDGAVSGTKVFTGHAGEVTSVVASKDQSWFATGGTDQTLAAWSLKDWKKSEPGLGAKFEDRDGVAVEVVESGSPGWEAGLRVGDVLDLLVVDKFIVFDRRKGARVGTVAAALDALKAPQPGIELFFGIAAKEKSARRDTLTTVRQRPLWKWFPAFDAQNHMNDWVVWMWHGSYYHTKTANGDRLAGWHVNHPEPSGRPEFYQLQQFEKLFHLPEVIEKLTETGDAGTALVAARGETPALVPFTKYEPAPVRVALKALDVQKVGLPLTISMRARGTNPDLLPERVELWVNDHLAESWPRPGQVLDSTKPFDVPYTIPANKFRTGENQVTVLAFNAAGGRAEEMQVVRNALPPADANLLALLTAVNDYSDTRKNVAGARKFGDLKNAHDDATALSTELEKCAGAKLLYVKAKIDLQLDPERKTFAAELARIADAAKPDDTLVVFFAGHGDLLMPKDGALPPRGRGVLVDEGEFLFCCPNYSPTKPRATAYSADELFAALAKINCRKVVLLDACHSGRATTANVLRRCVPNGQGPMIIAACDWGEQSYEHPKYGHGLFTFAVLDALDKTKGYRKADYDSDGALSPEELYGYVAAKVPDLLKRAGLKEPQTPVCFPRQLSKTPLLKR